MTSISARAVSTPWRLAMPKLRWTSALFTTMSTLPAISAASSRTFFESVTSSGTSVTWGIFCSSSKPANFFQGSAWPTQIDFCLRCGQCFDQRLSERGLAVGDEHLALLRVAGEFAQLPVVCHVGVLLVGQGGDHRLPGAVEHRSHAHSLLDCFMKMGHHGRPAVELDQAQAPGEALAEEEIVAVMQDGLRQQLALAGCCASSPERPKGTSGRPRAAGIARCRSRGIAAARSAQRRRRGQAERDAAARRRRQRRQPRAKNRVLTLWPSARIAAPLPRPRS